MSRYPGWIFDVDPVAGGLALWLIGDDGRTSRFVVPFAPVFCFGGSPAALLRASAFLRRAGVPVRIRRTEKTDLMSGRPVPLLEAAVADPPAYGPLVKGLAAAVPEIELANADLPVPEQWFFTRDLFPLARVIVEADGDEAQAIHLDDSRWALDYALPPLRAMHVRLEGEGLNPNHLGRRGARARLEVGWGGPGEDVPRRTLALEEDGAALIRRLNRLVAEEDPDLLLTDWGDSFLLPRLAQVAREAGVPLRLSRDADRPDAMARKRPRSFWTYGRVVRRGGRYLSGRWHLDRQNSFTLGEAGLDGLVELARLTGIPGQRLARSTIGTGLSAMELRTAWRANVLIPFRKREPEGFKTAAELVETDKGGLVYLPRPGWHEQVAELDFASMYPTLMVTRNISPETVNCGCCRPGNPVPGLRHTICRRRRGLVPETLAPLVAKRGEYKARAKAEPDPARAGLYRRRAVVHKWILVTCFGYLGYKHARVGGRIEAHECVTGWGREVLLRAKETVEARGFRMLHAIVDSLWVYRAGATEADYRDAAGAVAAATGLPVSLEGVYRWLRFCPSKEDAQRGVANRYVGAFTDDTVKIRGLAARRHDTPPFIRRAQLALLAALGPAKDLADYAARLPGAREMLAEFRRQIRDGSVPLLDLAVSTRLSRRPADYRRDTPAAIAARQLAGMGVDLEPGETVQYLITSPGDRDVSSRVRALACLSGDTACDAAAYDRLLVESCAPLFSGLPVPAPPSQEGPEAGEDLSLLHGGPVPQQLSRFPNQVIRRPGGAGTEQLGDGYAKRPGDPAERLDRRRGLAALDAGTPAPVQVRPARQILDREAEGFSQRTDPGADAREQCVRTFHAATSSAEASGDGE